MSLTPKCGREVIDGNGFYNACERPAGHAGPHKSYWSPRGGGRRVWLEWTHERSGHAVWPEAPGAEKVSKP